MAKTVHARTLPVQSIDYKYGKVIIPPYEVDIEFTPQEQAALESGINANMIPNTAGANNPLADKLYVNQLIAASLASFLGSYNLVTDLHLSISATQSDIVTALVSAITGAGANDYCYVQIPIADATPTQLDHEERYKFNGTSWEYEFSVNDSPEGYVFDVSTYNNNAKYSDLSAALAAIPNSDSVKKGGMSIKFIQSSDNKYVQFRLKTTTFSTTVTDWEGMDDFVSTAQQSFSDAKKQQARENIEAMFAGCDPVISEAFAMIWNELQGVRGLLFDSGYSRPSFFVKNLDTEEMSVCGFPLVLTCDVAGAPAAARIPSNWNEDSMGFWTGVPMFEGQRYHDRVSKKVYEAVNVTNSTNDWVLLN